MGSISIHCRLGVGVVDRRSRLTQARLQEVHAQSTAFFTLPIKLAAIEGTQHDESSTSNVELRTSNVELRKQFEFDDRGAVVTADPERHRVR